MQMCYSWAEILLACLLFGHSVAENGFFGFFIIYVRQILKVRNLRASVATANAQGAISAMLGIWMIYFGCYRARGLSRMILYAYSTYIAGMLLLWLTRFASTQFLILALVLITIGQAGERCLVHFFGADWEEGPNFYDVLLKAEIAKTEERQVEDKEKEFRKRVKLVFAKLPGAIIGTFYVSSLSWDQTFSFTALAMLAGYHIFFWFGPKIFYESVSTIEERNAKELIESDTSLSDQLKKAISVLGSGRLFLLWLTFAFTCNLVSATGNTFFIAQVGYLVNNTKQSFRNSVSIFYFVIQTLTNATSLGCDYLIIREAPKKQWRVRLFRVVFGMFLSLLCCIVACLVERRRSDSGSNSISVFWLIPQYLLLGLMRGIGNGGLSGFLSDCTPESRKNKITVVCAVAEACGNIISAVLASVSPSSWIGTDIGRSDLYYYYLMLTFISLCSSVLFVIIVSGFKLLGKYPCRER